MKKVLITWAQWMLATDFISTKWGEYEIISCDRQSLDITSLTDIRTVMERYMPDIVLNCAAYTNVDEAEDSGKKASFDINTLWVYHLAKVTSELGCDLITISTDYVFDGKNRDLYHEDDICSPLGNYGMSKYLWEQLAREENPYSIIIRTSWLYGGGPTFKNFVNTMLRLAESRPELNVVNDQFGSPTYTVDLSHAISQVIDHIETYRWRILHLSNETPAHGISWFEFAREIFHLTNKQVHINACSTDEFPSKAKRPQYSKLQNQSDIRLVDWKTGLAEYIESLKRV
jgi:dTDP-4-dehydrorhamnose reductase